MKGKQALMAATRRADELGADLARLKDRFQSEKQARIFAEKKAVDRDTLATEVSRLRELNRTGSSDELIRAKRDGENAERNVRRLLLLIAKRDEVEEAMWKVIQRRGTETEDLEEVIAELRGEKSLILINSPEAKPGSRHSEMIERKRRKKARRAMNSASRPRYGK